MFILAGTHSTGPDPKGVHSYPPIVGKTARITGLEFSLPRGTPGANPLSCSGILLKVAAAALTQSYNTVFTKDCEKSQADEA